MAAWRCIGAPALAAAMLLGACAPVEPGRGTLALSFEDSESPTAFSRRGWARPAPEGSPDGLWAVVAGLPQPERATVTHLATGTTVEVALFRASRRTNPVDIRVSEAAAEALGIGGEPAPVEVTALRREARLGRADRF